MFKHLDSLQTDQVKDTMFLVEHEPDDVVIREGTRQDSMKLWLWNKTSICSIFKVKRCSRPRPSVVCSLRYHPPGLLQFSLYICSGDAGDNFYVIDEGTFNVYIKKEGVETKVPRSQTVATLVARTILMTCCGLLLKPLR